MCVSSTSPRLSSIISIQFVTMTIIIILTPHTAFALSWSSFRLNQWRLTYYPTAATTRPRTRLRLHGHIIWKPQQDRVKEGDTPKCCWLQSPIMRQPVRQQPPAKQLARSQSGVITWPMRWWFLGSVSVRLSISILQSPTLEQLDGVQFGRLLQIHFNFSNSNWIVTLRTTTSKRNSSSRRVFHTAVNWSTICW